MLALENEKPHSQDNPRPQQDLADAVRSFLAFTRQDPYGVQTSKANLQALQEALKEYERETGGAV